jgi:hypothetical protein
MMIDLYDYRFEYKYKKKDKVTYNKKIFRKCPFEKDEIKEINEVVVNFVGIEGIRQWWCWWEVIPTNRFKRVIYLIKFYHWYYTKFRKL